VQGESFIRGRGSSDMSDYGRSRNGGTWIGNSARATKVLCSRAHSDSRAGGSSFGDGLDFDLPHEGRSSDAYDACVCALSRFCVCKPDDRTSPFDVRSLRYGLAGRAAVGDPGATLHVQGV
jgi:hypothetical protein